MKEALSYDDVLLKPKKSSVTDLSQVDTSVDFSGIELEVPVLSAAMDTVTEEEMAEELANLGCLGVIHRFLPVEEQAEMVARVEGNAAAAVGLKDRERSEELVAAGLNCLVVDIAHGHHEKMMEEVNYYSEAYPEAVLVAGNVATREGARDLEEAGADAVKIGIGPGSACTTRQVAGAGVPQFTAVKECSQAVEVPVIADGGIRKPGDLVKAIMAGATAGMIGGMFAGTDEAPDELVEEKGQKYKVYRGMSSEEAARKRAEREEREIQYEDRVSEGVETRTEYKGSVERVVKKLEGGLKSGISYCGADNIPEARKNSEFVKVTDSTQWRNGAHIEKL